MDDAFLIRPLVAADAAVYRSLMLAAYERDAQAFTSTAAERAAEPLAWWAQRIAHPGGLAMALGAFAGERLVGSVALEFSQRHKTRHKAVLIGMIVEPDARGRGLGRALVAAALAQARARPGLRQISLTVTEGNEAALGLYRAMGFQVFGVEPMGLRMPQGDRARLHLWQALAAD